MSVPADDLDCLTPEELFARYRGGDVAAARELTRQILPALFAFLTHYLGEIDAVGALRETCRRLARAAAAYDAERTRLPFLLYRLAREAAIDALAASPASAGPPPLSAILRENLPPQPNVEDLGLRLTRAASALPLAQKDVFLLREDADLNFAEISEILDCSVEQTQNHLRAAFGNLSAALAEIPALNALLKHL
ncbi:hypothetical protein AGMMS49959_02870 [Planctomycetales bacterium]|nr:hypothetical protein AGMMS49959_02870 [Planctomycetales bacterium]